MSACCRAICSLPCTGFDAVLGRGSCSSLDRFIREAEGGGDARGIRYNDIARAWRPCSQLSQASKAQPPVSETSSSGIHWTGSFHLPIVHLPHLASTMQAARFATRAAMRASFRPAFAQVARRGYADVAPDKIQLSLALPHQVRRLSVRGCIDSSLESGKTRRPSSLRTGEPRQAPRRRRTQRVTFLSHADANSTQAIYKSQDVYVSRRPSRPSRCTTP